MARHFSELMCWRLARALQREVFKITSKPIFNGDLDLKAEGFSRRTHKDQANFFATALASLNEVEDELGEAVDDGYLTKEEISAALNLKKRSYVAASRFRNSLRNRPDPEWNRWPKPRVNGPRRRT